MNSIVQDFRHALRGLTRARAVGAAAVLTLAVGTAGTTAMFALVHGVLLRPLPVPDQDRVIVAWSELRSTGATHWPFGRPHLDLIASESRLLERVAGVGYTGAGPMVVVEDGASSYVGAASVTGDFFDVLAVPPALGRTLTRADDVAGAEPVLVITHRLWQQRYGGSRDVIGRRVSILERPFTIVGVMPADVEYPRGVDAWMSVAAQTAILTNPNFHVDVDLIARLREGITVDQAFTELQAIVEQISADVPANAPLPPGLTPIVRTYENIVVGDVRSTVWALFGAVALVLLIASANAANLLLLRSEARRAELAVRAALGAGRARLARPLLAESLLLSLVAGAAGLALAAWALPILLALAPVDIPRVDSVRIDAGVVLFATAMAFLTAAAAGLAPALSSSRTDVITQLRSGDRGAVGRVPRRARRGLVAAQVALAVAVVAAAGLLTRSVLHLQAVDVGLAAERLVLVELVLPQARYADRTRHLQFLNQVIERLEVEPAVARATPINNPPYGVGWDMPRFTAEGQSDAEAAGNPALNLESIHPGYFETFGVRIVRGRALTDADRQGAPEVAIVSEDVAARTWPGQDPIGRRLKIGGLDSPQPWRTVVGVAASTRYRALAEPRPTLYLPAEQFIVSAQLLMLRPSAPPNVAAQLVRDRVRDVDPAVHVMRAAAFADLLDEPLALPRFSAFLMGLFGMGALLLAAIGLYAVMAASVRQRHAEIGLRVALGATAPDVRRLILRKGLSVAAIGATVGLAGAMMAARMLRSLLFEVQPLDPQAMVAAALLVVGVSAMACYLPARRAARMDPMTTLRAE